MNAQSNTRAILRVAANVQSHILSAVGFPVLANRVLWRLLCNNECCPTADPGSGGGQDALLEALLPQETAGARAQCSCHLLRCAQYVQRSGKHIQEVLFGTLNVTFLLCQALA